MTEPSNIGSIGWQDLTVEAASTVRDFYAEVVGWTATEVSMGDYDDYSMVPPGSDIPVAGICHAKGTNASLPPQWLLYITVEDVEASAARAAELGGAVIDGPRALGGGRFAVIRDPAGAICAVYAPAGEE